MEAGARERLDIGLVILRYRIVWCENEHVGVVHFDLLAVDVSTF